MYEKQLVILNPALESVVGGNGFEPMTSAMSTRIAMKQLKSYQNRLTLRGLSVNYVNKLSELLARYVEFTDLASSDTAEEFLLRYVDRKPNTRARYATYIRGFLEYLGIP